MGKTKEIRGFKRGIICILFLLGMVLSLGGRANAAETITSGQIVTGEIDNGSKTFEFIAPENGTVSVEVTVVYEGSILDKYWTKIYDSSNFYVNSEDMRDLVSKRNFEAFFGSKKDEIITINVGYKGKCEYTIICDFDTREDYEQEGNNFFEYANLIENKKTYFGSLFDENDVDYYKFSLEEDSDVLLNFGPERIETFSETWEVNLFSETDELNAVWSEQIGDSGWKNTLALSKGNYIIKVSKGDYHTDRSYRLYLDAKTLAVQKPNVKVKGIVGGISLTWNSLKDSEGYEVEFCSTRNFNCPRRYVVVRNSKKISNLRSKKMYYVRVRAFRSTVTGEKVYSQYCKIKNVRTK